MSECSNCIKYNGDCGYHLKDERSHINYNVPSEIYVDKCGYCLYYEARPKVKHQFVFETTADWVPDTDACWTECPFSRLTDLGKTCKFRREMVSLKCPFTV